MSGLALLCLIQCLLCGMLGADEMFMICLQMLRILNGEPYCSVSEKMMESSGVLLHAAAAEDVSSEMPTKFRSVCDSGISSINILSQQRSGFAEQGGSYAGYSSLLELLSNLTFRGHFGQYKSNLTT